MPTDDLKVNVRLDTGRTSEILRALADLARALGTLMAAQAEVEAHSTAVGKLLQPDGLIDVTADTSKDTH
jgi:hypothetical protein